MRVLTWHWGRRGAGPVFAAQLHAAFATTPNTPSSLSLAAGAEILRQPNPPHVDWAEPTYSTAAGYLWQQITGRLSRSTLRHLRALAPDIAVCAMPALLDQRMTRALRRTNTPYAVIVHDAAAHPGDGLSFRLLRQSRLLRSAAALFPLTGHVEAGLRGQGFGRGSQTITRLWHPPFYLGEMPPPFGHPGPPRLLCFGRLLPYKGLDLLADALDLLGPLPFALRICGDGPVSAELNRLRAIPGVEIDHRWIPEAELHALIAWSDAVILPYRQASQSGVAAAALGQGRLVIATNVGGLPEQLANQPGAILCDPNPKAIAIALTRLLRPAIATPAQNPKADWQAMAAIMLETLNRKIIVS